MEKLGLIGWIKQALGLYKNPPYVEKHLQTADVRSASGLALVVVGVEIWMLIRYTLKWGDKCDSIGEFFHYTYGYWYLLIAGVVMLVYSMLFLSNRIDKLKKISRLVILLFFFVGLYFGMQTSLKDFSKGRMIICFLATLMYVTVINIWRPLLSVVLTVGIAGFFVHTLNTACYDEAGNRLAMDPGDMINYITFILILIILEVNVYFQRYLEAYKSFNLEQAAITDDLTGLPNIRRFDEEAKEFAMNSLTEGRQPICMVINILNFKTFNDRFGYSVGDDLLRKVGEITSKIFSDGVYARQDRDHFAIMTDSTDYIERIEKIRKQLKETYPTETYLDVKTGMYFLKEGEFEPRRLLDKANHAMKLIKNEEEVFIKEYDDELSRTYELRQYVLNNLERAIKNGYIKPYYQPVMWSENGKLCGAEALARWIDPEMGFLSPGQFIPILEESRQIHKLDLCIYDSVLKRMRDCLDKGEPVLPTSMNFSRLDFELMDAVGELEKLVAKYNIPKEYIHVEVTESALPKNVDEIRKAMERLHESGYVIWLDDFGSGYSSMNVLKDFDFDLLKIDMEFLKNFHGNPNARKIISSIINLADSLNMRTLAEGVETEEAVEFLREAGCGRLQGFYYGKPMTYEEIMEKLNSGEFVLDS
ncbi:MAG: EAL domain-containing protein [Lachnospiraceae bacterium]|nr:EAL domain-containing protein [Lachnospiraceae bacterium]